MGVCPFRRENGPKRASRGPPRRPKKVFHYNQGTLFSRSDVGKPWKTDLGPFWDTSWATLGPLLGPSWAILGPSRAILAPSCCHFGPSCNHLGPSFGRLGPLLGHLGVILGPSSRHVGSLGPSGARLDSVLAIREPSCVLFGLSAAMLYSALWLCFAPFLFLVSLMAALLPRTAKDAQCPPSCTLRPGVRSFHYYMSTNDSSYCLTLLSGVGVGARVL